MSATACGSLICAILSILNICKLIAPKSPTCPGTVAACGSEAATKALFCPQSLGATIAAGSTGLTACIPGAIWAAGAAGGGTTPGTPTGAPAGAAATLKGAAGGCTLPAATLGLTCFNGGKLGSCGTAPGCWPTLVEVVGQVEEPLSYPLEVEGFGMVVILADLRAAVAAAAASHLEIAFAMIICVL
jgi:hypothetical protein